MDLRVACIFGLITIFVHSTYATKVKESGKIGNRLKSRIFDEDTSKLIDSDSEEAAIPRQVLRRAKKKMMSNRNSGNRRSMLIQKLSASPETGVSGEADGDGSTERRPTTNKKLHDIWAGKKTLRSAVEIKPQVTKVVVTSQQWVYIQDNVECIGAPACPQPSDDTPSPYVCPGGASSSSASESSSAFRSLDASSSGSDGNSVQTVVTTTYTSSSVKKGSSGKSSSSKTSSSNSHKSSSSSKSQSHSQGSLRAQPISGPVESPDKKLDLKEERRRLRKEKRKERKLREKMGVKEIEIGKV